jgi:hypothetical protein
VLQDQRRELVGRRVMGVVAHAVEDDAARVGQAGAPLVEVGDPADGRRAALDQERGRSDREQERPEGARREGLGRARAMKGVEAPQELPVGGRVEGALGYDDFSDSWRLSAERILDIADVRQAYARALLLEFSAEGLANQAIDQLRQTLQPYRDGRCPVWLRYRNASATALLALGDDWRVRPCDELLNRLSATHGAGTVRMEY